jgi:hypothetical protein
MNIQQFLEHHGIRCNPFSEEDAQTDPVFKEHCISSTYHPAWDKVFGNPAEPSTSIVFGEKGSGKTALRLQIVRGVEEHNRTHPDNRLFVIEYDDFNPFLDRFRDKLSPRYRRADKVLNYWKLWDHMDAILSLGVTQLVDWILESRGRGSTLASGGAIPLDRLDRHQSRDLLLLAACYDQSPAETFRGRWSRLRRKLKFRTWQAHWPLAVGIIVTLAIFGLIIGIQKWDWLATPWPYLMAAAGWLPWLWQAWSRWWLALGITRQLRVVNHEANSLRRVLMNFTSNNIDGQPLPNKDRSDDRYELLGKFQGVLRTLGFSGIFVLVDRVDEPHLVNGSAEQMRALLWPMLDNKFLKHQGIGFKLLLPVELYYYVKREEREFYERARLDKQNMIPSLEWSGEALYDIATARLRACAAADRAPALKDLFDDAISDRRLIESLRGLRVPRHAFKFLHRLLVAHANTYTDEAPSYKITPATFESVLAVYQRDQEAIDRGVGAG